MKMDWMEILTDRLVKNMESNDKVIKSKFEQEKEELYENSKELEKMRNARITGQVEGL